MAIITNVLLLVAIISSSLLNVVIGQCDANTPVNLPSSNGVITSPNFPDNYGNNANCQWRITATSPQAFVQINITEFCSERTFDYLRFYDGAGTDASTIAVISGCDSATFSQIANVITSSQPVMVVQFVSDESNRFTGFTAAYTTIQPIPPNTGCAVGREPTSPGAYPVTSTMTTLPSPFYPGNYINNLFCQGIFSTESGTIIVLNITNFCTEDPFDTLCFYDGNTMLSPLILCLSGCPRADTQIRSTQPNLFVRFVSDATTVYHGFVMKYSSVTGGNAACVSRTRPLPLSATTGFIASPNYPALYSSNANCAWTLTAPINQVIRFFLLDFCTERPWDTLTINDGINSTSSLLVKFAGCPAAELGTYTTSQRYMYLQFTSDATFSYRGFNLSYSFIPAALPTHCAATPSTPNRPHQLVLDVTVGGRGNISSPYYPNYFPNNVDCQWQIRGTPPQSIITLTMTFMSIEQNYDFIRIYDGNSHVDANLLAQLTGVNNATQTFTSTQRNMFVRFESDVSLVYRGFTATYTASRA